MTGPDALKVRGLGKALGNTVAVSGVNLAVPPGAMFSLLPVPRRRLAAALLTANLADPALVLLAVALGGLIAPRSRRGHDTGTVVLAAGLSIIAVVGTLLPVLATALKSTSADPAEPGTVRRPGSTWRRPATSPRSREIEARSLRSAERYPQQVNIR